jgi:hypothetical protein
MPGFIPMDPNGPPPPPATGPILARVLSWENKQSMKTGSTLCVFKLEALWPSQSQGRIFSYVLNTGSPQALAYAMPLLQTWLAYYGLLDAVKRVGAFDPDILIGRQILFNVRTSQKGYYYLDILQPSEAAQLNAPLGKGFGPMPAPLPAPTSPGTPVTAPAGTQVLKDVELKEVAVTADPLPGQEFSRVDRFGSIGLGLSGGDWCDCFEPDFVDNTAGGKSFKVCRGCNKEKQP